MKTEFPKVSIVIPHYNSKYTIKEVVECVKSQEYPNDFEIIIRDNCSTDEEAKENLKKLKGVKVIVNEKNLGLARSMNEGIESAQYDYVVTLHSDAKPSNKNWLKKLIEPFTKDPSVIASVSRNSLSKEIWQEWGYWHRAFSANEVKSFYPSLDGRSTAFKKEVIIKCGLFDGDTFESSGEDVDLFYKLKDQGNIVRADTEIVHLQGPHRSSFKKQLFREYQYGEGLGANIRRHGLKIFSSICRVTIETSALISIPLFYRLYYPLSVLGILIFLIMANIAILPYQLKLMKPDLRNIILPYTNFIARSVYIFATLRGFIVGKQKLTW